MGILILDIGTTSMRGILYSQKGEQLAFSRRKNHPEYHDHGWVTENPQDWSRNSIEIIHDIVEQAGSQAVEAVAITSQRSSIIPVNKDGNPLMDTIMWHDVRNKEICQKLSPLNETLFAKTGARVNTVFSGSKMTWVRFEQPSIYADTFKFVNIPEYINFLMTGKYCSDYTYASRTGLFNIHTREFDPELLKLYCIEKDKLCRLVEPGSVSGYSTKTFQNLTGLTAGTPVIHAGGDQQCASIGLGVTSAGKVSIVAGTGGFLMAAAEKVPENLRDDVICNCASIPGKYVIESNVLTCSAAYDWAIREFYGIERPDYNQIEKELVSEEKITDCLVVPYFSGRGTPDWNPSARAIYANISLSTTRREMLKSTMESVFMELNNHLQTFASYINIERVYGSGGLTHSRTLNQMQADIFGRPIMFCENPEATSLGALMVTLAGIGFFSSVEEAAEQMKSFGKAETYYPDLQKHALYEAKREKMNALYEVCKGSFCINEH
jgi:sugar (pentulose or hexulose) kinase